MEEMGGRKKPRGWGGAPAFIEKTIEEANSSDRGGGGTPQRQQPRGKLWDMLAIAAGELRGKSVDLERSALREEPKNTEMMRKTHDCVFYRCGSRQPVRQRSRV